MNDNFFFKYRITEDEVVIYVLDDQGGTNDTRFAWVADQQKLNLIPKTEWASDRESGLPNVVIPCFIKIPKDKVEQFMELLEGLAQYKGQVLELLNNIGKVRRSFTRE